MCFPAEDLCWQEAAAGEIHGKKKKPTTKGTVGLSSQFNMEEESWRLGWKDKNLISRGRKCRKTNKNDGRRENGLLEGKFDLM